MFIVVAYDISDDKRRTRLHKALKRFGEAVQYSVFECLLTEERFGQMCQAVAKVVEDGDDLRYYDLCEACHREAKTCGRAKTTKKQALYVV